MASESTSSQQSSHLSPLSKVNFKCEAGIIAYNNAVALLEHSNNLYHPMLSFLSNYCISTALTRQSSATYVEYLKEFWYTVEEEFISAIGLPVCTNVVSLPLKETVRAGLATLGLFDKDKPYLSSFVLVNSSPLKIKYFTPTWRIFMQYIGLEIDIGTIIFSNLVHKLQNRKKPREANICYTRFLSLIFEKLLGENYINNALTFVKRYTISATSFQTPLASEVPLTSHMLKVAKLFQELEQSLILSFEKVNADDGADKVVLPKTQVAETQPAEETVATADATKSLEASESAEEQVNQPKTAEAKKVLDQKVQEEVKESGLESMRDVTFEQIMDEIDQQNKAAQEKPESPYDTESEIKVIKRFKPRQSDDDAQITFLSVEPYDQTKSRDDASDSDSGLRSMPNDDLVSLTGFATPAKSDPLGHLHDELRTLKPKVVQLESSISKAMADEIKSSIPSFFKKANVEGEKWEANAEGDKWEKNNPKTPTKENPNQNQGEQQSVEKSSEKNVSEDEPLAKKLKFLIPTSLVLSPTPLKSIMPEPTQRTKITKMSFYEFSEHLTQTTSSIFSPTPLRELTPLRDPNPPRDKGKVIATKEPLKDLMPYIKEGGFVLKMPKLKSFITPDEQLKQEDIMDQVREMKRLADLKAEKKKSEASLKKIMNPANIKAQALKIAEYAEKRAKMLEEFNKCIYKRTNPLPITKISYRVKSSKEASMRITRGNDPLNLTVYDKFRLRTLGFNEWLELGVPPPPELSTFGISMNDRKRKRSSEILQEVFVKENIVVDGMQRNLILPSGIEGSRGRVIREPESWIFFYNGNFDLVFQREEEFHLATTAQLIRLQSAIQRGTPLAEEMFRKLELTIKARDDVN
ncbi:hypothetical protein Tco_0624284 [Tanacetum coccineum]|uniref:Uncharacterized protein n=1 Tax=Tanacetum coccineum TaxID=301880 RepID=A0ABQ4WDL3_9ASTR